MYENKFRMTPADNILFAKRNIIDSIYKEAKLEGIGVTFPDTYEIFNGRTVAGLSVDDTIKINNLKHAWEFVFETMEYPIDLRYVCQLNTEIGRGVVLNEGMLRTEDVAIGGTTWKPSIPVQTEIEDFFSRINENQSASVTDKAIETMLFIMRSQMFYDGNKRTAQLAANKIMIEGGAGVISIPVDCQVEFVHELIDYYESGDRSSITEFVYKNCVDGINSKNSIISGNAISDKEDIRATIERFKKEHSGTERLSQEIVNEAESDKIEEQE